MSELLPCNMPASALQMEKHKACEKRISIGLDRLRNSAFRCTIAPSTRFSDFSCIHTRVPAMEIIIFHECHAGQCLSRARIKNHMFSSDPPPWHRAGMKSPPWQRHGHTSNMPGQFRIATCHMRPCHRSHTLYAYSRLFLSDGLYATFYSRDANASRATRHLPRKPTASCTGCLPVRLAPVLRRPRHGALPATHGHVTSRRRQWPGAPGKARVSGRTS